MILSQMTWQDVSAASKDAVVLIPTGSLEQHGPHLPLFTDTILATAAAEGVEQKLGDKVLLTPTIWQGASGHHLSFSGTISASFEGYGLAVEAVVDSLMPHGFWKFYILNGHGGNTEPNGIACRKLKEANREILIGHSGYFQHMPEGLSAEVMEGPEKSIKHACEAEASMMMHVRPDLVRTEKLRDDGFTCEPEIDGMVWMFNEMTEEGSRGYATYATAEKGRRLMEAAIEGSAKTVEALADGPTLNGYS
jgi:creatinine amidohydrolase